VKKWVETDMQNISRLEMLPFFRCYPVSCHHSVNWASENDYHNQLVKMRQAWMDENNINFAGWCASVRSGKAL